MGEIHHYRFFIFSISKWWPSGPQSLPYHACSFILHVGICHCEWDASFTPFDRQSELLTRSLQSHSNFFVELVFRHICNCLVRMSLLGFPSPQNHPSWGLLLVFLVGRRCLLSWTFWSMLPGKAFLSPSLQVSSPSPTNSSILFIKSRRSSCLVIVLTRDEGKSSILSAVLLLAMMKVLSNMQHDL